MQNPYPVIHDSYNVMTIVKVFKKANSKGLAPIGCIRMQQEKRTTTGTENRRDIMQRTGLTGIGWLREHIDRAKKI